MPLPGRVANPQPTASKGVESNVLQVFQSGARVALDDGLTPLTLPLCMIRILSGIMIAVSARRILQTPQTRYGAASELHPNVARLPRTAEEP